MFEVVYKYQDGREEVRYRRPDNDYKTKSEVAILQARLKEKCPYFIRDIKPEISEDTL